MEKLSELTSELQTQIRKAIQMASDAESTSSHLDALADGASAICTQILNLGDYCFEVLKEAPSNAEVDSLPLYVCNFFWANDAKAFLILWRNSIFEQKKAAILAADGLVEAGAPAELRSRTMAKLEEMGAVINEGIEKESAALRQQPKGGLRAINKWRLQKNPWPVFREQIDEVPAQCQDIAAKYDIVVNALETLHSLDSGIETIVRMAETESATTNKINEQALTAISEETQKGEEARPGSLAAKLEHIQEQVLLPNHLGQFLTQLDELCEKLPDKVSLTIEARAGILHTLETNLLRRTESWLEANILPLLYELWEITESGRNGTKMALVNARNRAIHLASESGEQKKHDLRNEALGDPLLHFKSTIENSKIEFVKLQKLVARRLEKSFKLGLAYQGKDGFISGPAPSSFDQFGRNKVMRDIVTWGKKQVRSIRSLIRRVEQEEALSVSEKIVRYIESRQSETTDSQYASIFLTRGYIGESFCVGREDEIAHFAKLVDQWKLGYRGSVCLTGNRFSGKSLFGELVAHRFFQETAIRIAPGETVRVEGRKVQLSYDLESALNEIRKIMLNKRPLIWIDDLELWWDPSISLNKNVRALRSYLDSHATDMFFMVSMSNVLRSYLNKFLNLDRVFQAEINMDRMSAVQIREAISVRHGATNRKLVDAEDKEVPPQQLHRLTNRIHRASLGNVGEALNMWSQSTIPIGPDSVRNDFSEKFSLPDFITPDSGLLLSYMMAQKKTNEYHLRKLFGPAFQDKYAHILKRLLSVGVLDRQMDGSLEINKSVVNELGELLESHDYLKYRKWKG